MRRRRVDSQLERQFLIGLLTQKAFLSSAAPVLDVELLQTRYAQTVAKWCLDYYREYGDAPGRNIEPVFHAWVEQESRDETQVEAIETLLSSLSEESDSSNGVNVPYLLDELGGYLSTRRLHRLNDELSARLMQGDREGALREVGAFRAVDLGQGVGFDPLNNRSVWTRAFAEPAHPLIEFPGDAGRFLNQALTRDALIAVQGPEKRGKTFWCLEFVMRALRDHRRVAMFEVGDLSESQIVRRMAVRLAGLPQWESQCGDVRVPIGVKRLEAPEEGGLDVECDYDVKKCRRPVGRQAALQAAKAFMRGCGHTRREPYLLTSVHPNSTISVAGIEGILSRWRQEKDFIPDVVVVDYADILAPEDDRKEARNQVDETWRRLRRLSQEWHCLVIAPTQAKAAAYEARTQSMKHFAEDKRKMAHVTGMLGLNQTQAEKEAQVMRLNWIVLREGEFVTGRCLYVGQCLTLARSFCCSVM